MEQKINKLKVPLVIIGGGLAGLITAIALKKAHLPVILIEKKKYPFHRVCGEYVSNEVVPYLQSLDINPLNIDHASISQFEITSTTGRSNLIDLDLGGFGISRYTLDYFLYNKAIQLGVEILQETVEEVYFKDGLFTLNLKSGTKIISEIAVGAFGKRSNLDMKLDRRFFKRPSPYVGVKYHINYDIDRKTVALHNFDGGYCGINAIEAGKVNLCYLSHRSNLKRHKNIERMEKSVLFKNPHLNRIFNEAEFIFEKPEVINEISFETKLPVENHILMCGDAAGMITPLCGNGMAMAIHAAKLLSESIIEYQNHKERSKLEIDYTSKWNSIFKNRLALGRHIQRLFGSGSLSNLTVSISKIKPVANYLVKLTHGKPF
ncbi:MAG TPA: NAD(P)/FAD-dependent oxidoreductase [Fulvivirga sp.]|nr:NAD(P)/FAD-dependent oxidoreductase [Fulvivirga sp.]